VPTLSSSSSVAVASWNKLRSAGFWSALGKIENEPGVAKFACFYLEVKILREFMHLAYLVRHRILVRTG
jgi:hypothetical protein